jgi:hypothetical protein
MSARSHQLMTAYLAHRNKSDGIVRRYENLPAPDIDDFQSEIQMSFLKGVLEALQLTVESNMAERFGTQQEVAEVMGLKNHSSISHMNRSGSINGLRLAAALFAYPNQPLPLPELSALFGFARATSHVKAVALQDTCFERALKAPEFSYLVGVLAHSDWESAVCDRDEEKARVVAEQIIKERAIPLLQPSQKKKASREGGAIMLQTLWANWADFAVITLCNIPERIPDPEEV